MIVFEQSCRSVHIDYAGPSHSKMLLIVINAYSKWQEIANVNPATSSQRSTNLKFHGANLVQGRIKEG